MRVHKFRITPPTAILPNTQFFFLTLTVIPDRMTADHFLDALNSTHPSLKFTIEREGSLPFLGMELLNRAPKIESKVYIKRTYTSFLLHFQSHLDIKYMRSLVVNTMVGSRLSIIFSLVILH